MLIGELFKIKNKKIRNHFFSGLSFNSNSCKKNFIFFAIKGNLQDGNKYIDEAIENGARTIIHQKPFEGFKGEVLFLSYKNIRKILASTSFKFYNKIPNNIIAVTGTNGKSSVSDFYYQILKINNVSVGSIGTLGIKFKNKLISLNNTTLDSLNLSKYLSILKKKKIDNVILEASSHGLKQHRLDGLNITSAIFTNFSHDHLDYHKNLKNYLNSKLYLFNSLLKKNSLLITDRSIKEFKKIFNISKKRKLRLKTILDEKSDLQLINHAYEGEKQKIQIKYKNKIYSFYINLIGKTQIKNIFMSILAAESSKLNFEKIIKNISKLKPIDGRFEKIGNLKNNAIVILDYAHTPDALRTCLNDLKSQFPSKKINIVFGCGGDRDKYKRPKMGAIANSYCSQIYLTDDNPRFENPKEIRKEIKKNILKSKVLEISNRRIAISKAIQNLKSDEVLVVAGKGHEKIQDYGNKKIFFSDKEVIKKSIAIKNKKLSNNIKVNIFNEYFNKNISKKKKIQKASINSKTLKKNDIFFAIKGKKKDGNSFVKKAFDNGALFAIVNRYQKSINKTNQIKVSNTLECLTDLSKIIRQNFKGKIIAITGSCGKTSLKQMSGEVLNDFSKTTFSLESYNNKYGVPLSLFNLNTKNKNGVFEIGMDKKGEIDFLSKILNPNIGVITNISYAHAKNFKNINEIAAAKGELINNIQKGGIIILNKDDRFFDFHYKNAIKKDLRVFSFGIKKKGNISLISTKKQNKLFKITVKIFNQKKLFFIKNINQNNLYNVLACIGIIYSVGELKNLSRNSFIKFKNPKGRGDISKIYFKNKQFYLVDESYNSNPLSMESAIKNYNMIKTKNNKKHLLMGDMLELGSLSKKLHISLSKNINNSSIDKFHIFGRFVKETFKKVKNIKKGKYLTKLNQINDLIIKELNNNDYLMVKGSNSTGLNKFILKLKGNKSNAL